MKGKTILVTRIPKILDVTFDNMMTFGRLSKNISEKQKRHNVLKMIAGSDWGCTKETLAVTYKAIGRGVLNYAAPVWTPTFSNTNWNTLQTKQNADLPTVTGNLKMAPIENLHRATKMLPVKKHNELLSKQFLMDSYLPSRADHNTVTEPERKRTASPTLNGMLQLSTADIFHQKTKTLTKAAYKKGLKHLHITEVSEECIGTSKLLQTTGSEINLDEEKLPSEARIKLSQLRSGYSTALNSYNNRININVPDEFELCETDPTTLTICLTVQQNQPY